MLFCAVLLSAALCPALSQKVAHHFDLAKTPVTRIARCTMRLHNDGTEIGDVEFQSDGTLQQMDTRLESTAISEGDHGLHVHQEPVQGYDCGSTQGHYNPTENNHGSPLSFKGSRHIGDFGNVKADAKGRVNWQSKFVVREGSTNDATIHLEPLLQLEKRGRQRKGKKSKEGRQKGGKDKARKEKQKGRKEKEKKKPAVVPPVPKPEPEIVVDPVPEPEYVVQRPNYMYYAKYLVNSARFALDGEQSIVGRSVVLHAGQDDLGKGENDGSKATGNAGSRVACCTLIEV